MDKLITIESQDFWVKVVGMLQQNWALIERVDPGAARIYFVTDSSGVFDEIDCASDFTAQEALTLNGFRRLADSPDLRSFLRPPVEPFHRSSHPNGRIYSSGRFWRF